jgi:hypothetical protein
MGDKIMGFRRAELFIAICGLALIATSVSMIESNANGYLNVLESDGKMGGANYSQYTPAFSEFLGEKDNLNATQANYTQLAPTFAESGNAEYVGSDLSGYPLYLGRFLNQSYKPLPIAYSNFTPAFAQFIDPEWELEEANYTEYTPAFSEFMQLQWEPQQPSSQDYPQWMLDYLAN